MPTALPGTQRVSEKVFKEDPSSLSAYNIILTLEKSLLSQSNPHETSLMYARVVGYLLIYAPNHTARAYVRREVHICGAQEDPRAALLDLGKMFVQHFIRIFKIHKGREEYLSFYALKSMTKKTLVKDPQNYYQARNNALIRDRFRCVISGVIDHPSSKVIRELVDEIDAQCDAGERPDIGTTDGAYILSASGIDKGNEKTDSTASPWAILSKFGYGNLLDALKEKNIYHLGNMLTLSVTAHECFNRLIIWFEKTKTENRYKIGAAHEFLVFDVFQWPRFVNFTTTDPDLSLPSPEYLSLHATAAKVGHLSGATEYLDDMYEKEEELDVLSPDGSTAEILENALYRLTTPCIKAH